MKATQSTGSTRRTETSARTAKSARGNDHPTRNRPCLSALLLAVMAPMACSSARGDTLGVGDAGNDSAFDRGSSTKNASSSSSSRADAGPEASATGDAASTNGSSSRDGGSDGAEASATGDASSTNGSSSRDGGSDTGALPSGAVVSDYVGNTFAGSWSFDTHVEKHMQQWIVAAFVAPDGTVFTNGVWDEGGIDGGIYKNGNLVGKFEFGAGGFGRDGDGPVTANSKYAFAAMHQTAVTNSGNDTSSSLNNPPDGGATWYCVERYDIGTYAPATWPGADGFDNAMLLVNTTGPVNGIAADDTTLYVADPATQKILLYDVDSMAPKQGSFDLANAGQLVVGPDGTLWIAILSASGAAQSIVHYTTTGTKLPETISFPSTMNPTGFAIDGSSNTLAVADSGKENNIKLYELASLSGTPTTPSSTFGAKGGVPANGGKIAAGYLYNPQAVGFDSSGNIYVAEGMSDMGAMTTGITKTPHDNHGAGGLLESYVLAAASPTQNWSLKGLFWLDVGDLDPATETDLYFPDKHLVYHDGENLGQNWTWQGYTIDKFTYPSDPRLFENTDSGAVNVRHIDNQTFLYMGDQYGHSLKIYRLDAPSEIAVPVGWYGKAPEGSGWSSDEGSGEWLWLDGNGDGSPQKSEFSYPPSGVVKPTSFALSVDESGNIYTGYTPGASGGSATLRRLAIKGVVNGVPSYDISAIETTSAPSEITELCRVDYQVATDTMFVSGYTTAHPRTGTEGHIVGTEVIPLKGWSSGSPTEGVHTVLPYSPGSRLWVEAISIAGDYIFAGEYLSDAIDVYLSSAGTLATTLTPGAALGEPGRFDMDVSVAARQRNNGEYFIVAEDDHSIRQLVYRWMP